MNHNPTQTRETSDVYSRPSAYFDGDDTLVVRASAASGCRRALWYAATEHPISNPPTDESLTVMEAGNALEGVVVRAMERAGWDILPADPQDPKEVSIQFTPNLKVTGHPDATGVIPLFGGPEVIVEVKTRGPSAYSRWQTLGAERSHPESVAQLALYTFGAFDEARDGVIATMDTGSRAWDYEIIPADRLTRAQGDLNARLWLLSAHYVRYGADPETLPKRDFSAGSWQCKRCPFLNTCLPGMDKDTEGAGTGEIEGEEVTKEQAQEAVLAYKMAQESLKEPEQAKRRTLDTLRAWMRQRGADRETLDAGGVKRKVSLVTTKRYSVDYKRLNALLDPQTRSEIVTEQESEYVRVS